MISLTMNLEEIHKISSYKLVQASSSNVPSYKVNKINMWRCWDLWTQAAWIRHPLFWWFHRHLRNGCKEEEGGNSSSWDFCVVQRTLVKCSEPEAQVGSLKLHPWGPPMDAPTWPCMSSAQPDRAERWQPQHSEWSFLFLYTPQCQVFCQTQEIIHFKIMKCIRQ